jgi:hypothetical protein
MGVTRTTYCGPYVECKVSKTTPTFEKWRCSNPACEQHTIDSHHYEVKFCSKCGSAFKIVEVAEEVDAVNRWELEEEIEAALGQPFGAFEFELKAQGRHIWVGNKDPEDIGDKPIRSSFVCNEEESLTELQAADIDSQLKQFHRIYDEELKRLRSAYGPANVQVKWGIVRSVSC